MSQQRIVTPCPSCGFQTLFVSPGGHLTCSLIGCKSPGVEITIEALKREITQIRQEQVILPGVEGHRWEISIVGGKVIATLRCG